MVIFYNETVKYFDINSEIAHQIIIVQMWIIQILCLTNTNHKSHSWFVILNDSNTSKCFFFFHILYCLEINKIIKIVAS